MGTSTDSRSSNGSATRPPRGMPLVVLTAREDAKLKAEAVRGRGERLPREVSGSRGARGADQAPLKRLHQHAPTRRGVCRARQGTGGCRGLRPFAPASATARTDQDQLAMVSCQGLGGDSFGYHWIDDHHFAIYFLDVCGRGVGAALHSARIIQAVRASWPARGHRLSQSQFGAVGAERCLPDGTAPWHVRLRLVRRVRPLWIGVSSMRAPGTPPPSFGCLTRKASLACSTHRTSDWAFSRTHSSRVRRACATRRILYVFSNGVAEFGTGAPGDNGLNRVH